MQRSTILSLLVATVLGVLALAATGCTTEPASTPTPAPTTCDPASGTCGSVHAQHVRQVLTGMGIASEAVRALAIQPASSGADPRSLASELDTEADDGAGGNLAVPRTFSCNGNDWCTCCCWSDGPWTCGCVCDEPI